MSKLPREVRAPRHNEWTRAKMATFLRELAACQCVAQAARGVGMSRQSAYKLRNRLQHTPFALGWEVALEAGLQQLAHAVLDRAVNGEEVPHYYKGELVATHRRYDNFLSRWVLENPWKIGRYQLAREYSGEAFDRLLERIEFASLDWEEGEAIPGREADLGADDAAARKAEGGFLGGRSWYGADADGGGAGGPGIRRRS